LDDSNAEFANRAGLWSNRSGSLELIAIDGDHAPGTPDGVAFGGSLSLSFEFDLNSNGRIAFRKYLTGAGINSSNDLGLWSDVSGELELVARKGELAPGTPAGIRFTGFDTPILNAAGQIAFLASVAGDGIHNNNRQGIWVQDANGELRLIVRACDPFEVAPGDIRIPVSPYPIGLTDQGQLGFWIRFDDESEGLFVTRLANVPEPSSALLLPLAVFAITLRRPRAPGPTGHPTWAGWPRPER
jgi:hypothetical protein